MSSVMVSGRLQILQGYRGLVAAMIAVSHLCDVYFQNGVEEVRPIVDIGRIGGVDFFFVLSGFLIYRAYAKHAGNLEGALEFLKRRLTRIYPLLWLLTVPCYVLIKSLDNGPELDSMIIHSLLLIPGPEKPVLSATWSLTHVVFFYLVFFFFLLWRRAVLCIIALWCAVVLLQAIFGLFQPSAPMTKFVLSTFNLEFMAGCLLAVYAQRRNPSGGVLWIALGAILFVLGWITFGVLFVGVGVRTPLYTLASCALITGALAVEKHRDIRLPPIVDLLSAASYSMIVINLPVIVAATKILAYTGVLSAVHFGLTIPFIFLLVIAASIFVHVSIERPLIALFTATAFFDQLSLMLGRIDLRKPKDSI